MSTAAERKQRAATARRRRQRNRGAYNGYMKSWRRSNPEKATALATTVEQRFSVLKVAARRRDIACNLTLDEYRRIVSGLCHWCGGKLPPRGGGIDRLNTTVDYRRGNCVPCCKVCNHAKASMSQVEFFAWLKKVIRRHPEIVD